MYNIRYVENNLLMHESRRNLFYAVNATGFASFLALVFVLGPMVHETVQMGLLLLYNCHYVFVPSFDWFMGVYASVRPFCSLSRLQEIVLYSIGVSVNLACAFSFLLASWILFQRGRLFSSNLCLYLGIGFSLNPILYFFADSGNLINLMTVLGLRSYIGILPLFGALLFAIEVAYAFAIARHFKSEYENIMRRISRMREFVNSINFGE